MLMSSDDQIHEYYSAFCQFTGLHDENDHRRLDGGLNKARQKLLKLSKVHFMELSTDVYDEMQRRIEAKRDVLEPRADIHPRRNQARQKLTVLTESRFNDLAIDILLEIERRFPLLAKPEPTLPVIPGIGELSPDSLTARQKSPTLPQLNIPDINSPPTITIARYSSESGNFDYNDDQDTSPSTESNQSQNGLRSNTLIPTKDTLIEETEDDTDSSEEEDIKSPDETVENNHEPEISQSTPNLADTPQLPQFTPVTPNPKQDTTDKLAVFTPQLPISTPRVVDITPTLPTFSTPELDEEAEEDEPKRESSLIDDVSKLSDTEDEFLPSRVPQFDPMLDAITEEETQSDAPRPGFTRNDSIRRSIKYDTRTQLGRTLSSSQKYTEIETNMEETVKKLEQSLSESEELKSGLTEENARLHAMVSDLEDMRQTAQEEATELKKKVTQLENQNRHFERQFEEYNGGNPPLSGTNEKQLIDKHENAISELRAQHDEHITGLKNDHALALKVLTDKYEDVLTKIDEESELKTQEIKDEHSNKINHLISKHANERQQLLDQHMAEKAELVKEIDLAKAKLAVLPTDIPTKTIEADMYEENDYLKGVIQNLESTIQEQLTELSTVKERHAEALKKQNQFSEETAELTNKLVLVQKEKEQSTDAEKQDLQKKLISLESEHMDLHKQFEQQRNITEQVRKEAAEFLEEMRNLAENQAGMRASAELSEENQKLKLAVQEWKSRYSRAKGQLRSSRQSVMGLSNSVYQVSPIPLVRDSPCVSSHGIVRDVSVSQFQLSMDEFLLNTRSDPSHELFHYLHNLVLATRAITEEISSAVNKENISANLSSKNQLSQACRVVSNMANQLITVTRNHGTSAGLSPYSIIDAAASDLSFAVVEAAKLAKIRITDETLIPAGPMDRDDNNVRQSLKDTRRQSQDTRRPSHSSHEKGTISYPNGSNHLQEKSDPIEQPSPPIPDRSSRSFAKKKQINASKKRLSSGFDLEDPDNTIAELQGYLERKTVDAVDSIQDLLAGVREGSATKDLLPYLKRVIEVTDSMVDATASSMKQTRNWLLKNKGRAVLQDLEECGNRLDTLYADISESPEFTMDERQAKQQLAGISFDVAKYTKELVKTVEEVSLNAEIEDIDRQLQM